MWARFFIPVLALFYIASKVTIEEFALIMGVFALATLLLEIPSGVIADLLGKKKTLIISRSLYLVELFMIAFYDGFWIFLIAKIISGIGVSLSSGTDQALLYDTLKKLKRVSEHKKISGNLQTITSISMALVFIIGAYLFSLNPKLPAILSIPFVGIGFILTFFLEEPYLSSKKLSFKNSITHLKEGLSYFKNHNYIKYLAFYSVPLVATISICLSISSAYLEAILIPISLIGVVAFVGSLLASFASKQTYKWEAIIGERKSFFITQMGILLGVALMSLMIPKIGFIFLLIIQFVSGYFYVFVNHYTNHHIETSHRATMLSIKNMFNNLGIFIMFPTIGYITKTHTMQKGFIFLGGVLIIYFVVLYFYSKKLNLNLVR